MTTPNELPVSVRPEYREAAQQVDCLDRRIPHRLGLRQWMPMWLRWGIPSETIPDEFWSYDTDHDGYTVALVACPCGETPEVLVAAFSMCACERAFAFTGSAVWVLNSPKSRPADEEPECPPS